MTDERERLREALTAWLNGAGMAIDDDLVVAARTWLDTDDEDDPPRGHPDRPSGSVGLREDTLLLVDAILGGTNYKPHREAAERVRAALSSSSDPEAVGLDVEAAAHVLMRAGWARSKERAMQDAAVILLTAQTGERHDVDDDRLTPDQRAAIAALTDAKPETPA